MPGSGGAEQEAVGRTGHWAAAPWPPHAQEGVSCGKVIGFRDLLNDIVDYFTTIMSQCNLVMALHSHVHVQPLLGPWLVTRKDLLRMYIC